MRISVFEFDPMLATNRVRMLQPIDGWGADVVLNIKNSFGKHLYLPELAFAYLSLKIPIYIHSFFRSKEFAGITLQLQISSMR